jgi:hypothetical protein
LGVAEEPRFVADFQVPKGGVGDADGEEDADGEDEGEELEGGEAHGGWVVG